MEWEGALTFHHVMLSLCPSQKDKRKRGWFLKDSRMEEGIRIS